MSRRTYKVAWCLWLDAFATETEDEADHLLQMSAGVVIQNNRKSLKLAQIHDIPLAADDDNGARDIITIPKPYIVYYKQVDSLTAKQLRELSETRGRPSGETRADDAQSDNPTRHAPRPSEAALPSPQPQCSKPD